MKRFLFTVPQTIVILTLTTLASFAQASEVKCQTEIEKSIATYMQDSYDVAPVAEVSYDDAMKATLALPGSYGSWAQGLIQSGSLNFEFSAREKAYLVPGDHEIKLLVLRKADCTELALLKIEDKPL